MIYPCSGAEAHPDLGIIPGNHTRRTGESGEFVVSSSLKCFKKMMKDVVAQSSRIRKCKDSDFEIWNLASSTVDLPKQLIPFKAVL